MSIENDQKELRKQNRDYLRKIISDFFATAFTSLELEYSQRLNEEIFDPQNEPERLAFLKHRFDLLKNEPSVNLRIENKQFLFEWNEIERLLSFQNLCQSIYPTLEKALKNGHYPADFIRLRNHLKTSTERVYLKYLSNISTTPQKKATPKTFSTKYQHLFKPWGFEFFLYLDQHFTGIKAEQPRYTVIYLFLEIKGIFKGSAVDYREMVLEETAISIGFSRLADLDTTHHQFIKNEGFLNSYLEDFEEEYAKLTN